MIDLVDYDLDSNDDDDTHENSFCDKIFPDDLDPDSWMESVNSKPEEEVQVLEEFDLKKNDKSYDHNMSTSEQPEVLSLSSGEESNVKVQNVKVCLEIRMVELLDDSTSHVYIH